MNAFITLISSQDYLPAALVLNHSLKQVNSKYPLVVALTKDLATKENLNIFNNENIKVELIDKLNYGNDLQEYAIDKLRYRKTVLNTASKIQIFNLINYEKLVYIDADTLVLQNIDDLFSFYDGAILWWNEPMSGLFVFEPKNHNYDLYRFLLYNCLDGSALAEFFFPARNNMDYRISDSYMKNTLSINETKIIHYDILKKPFLMTMDEAEIAIKKYPAYFYYFRYLIPFKKKYNL